MKGTTIDIMTDAPPPPNMSDIVVVCSNNDVAACALCYSQDLLYRIMDADHPLYVFHGTNSTTITRKTYTGDDDEIEVMGHLKVLWDDAGLSEPIEVNSGFFFFLWYCLLFYVYT